VEVVPEGWIPPTEDKRGDVAVLKMTAGRPAGATAVPLRRPHQTEDRHFAVQGFPDGTLIGATGVIRTQLTILNRRRVRSLCGPLARHPLAPGCIQMSFVLGTPLEATDVEGWWRYPPAVGTRAERRAARERVAAYHEARLGELVESIAATIDRYRSADV
jgi:hypothetical protein